MKTNLPFQNLKRNTFFVLLLCFINIVNIFAQDIFDGKYCPGPGVSGDEYATGIVFSQQLNPSPSSTCEIGTIRAKVDTQNQVLRLGMNIGNGGAALFRLYLDTDNNATTGLTSDTFGGPLTVAGAEYILEINSNANTFNLYSGNGNIKTLLPINNGLAALNGSATGCNGGGGSFLEFNIPFGSIGFNICDINNPGLINITKLASVSGNSASSSRCIDTPLTFGIPLKGDVGPDATICSGANSPLLTVTGITANSTIVKWQSSISPFTTWIDIANTTTTYTGINLTQTTKFRAVFTNSGLCSGSNIATSQATITVSPPPTASISSQTNVDCFGNNSGSVTVAGANGTAPYTYAIDGTTFLPSGTFASLNAGSYTITIKDANGCNTTQDVTITQPNAALTASISSQTNVDCFGNNSGSVTVAGANGTAPYTYAIDGTTFLPSGTFTSLNAGSYTITIKDANRCNTTQEVTITQPNAALTASISSQTNVDCFGNNSGSVTVAGANGTAPYTYAIDGTTFLPSGTFTSLNAGSYTITIKDANGCNTTQDVTITQPNAALTASISSQTNVDCFGNNSGSVTVAGANGTAPYTYAIDGTTFLPSGTFTSLNAGSYTITIKDANGCNTTQEVTITQPNAALTASISSQTNVDCFGNNSGSVTVAGANGTAPYTYAIDGATFLPSGTFTSLNAGSYTITIKDANGCNTTQDVTITQPNAALTASISSQTNVDCFGNNSGSVTVAGANGTAPYTYAIDGATFLPSGTFTSLNAGSYTITIKDANECNTTQEVTITQPNAALTASISFQTNVDCFGNNSGSVTVAGANGTAPYTYAIDGTTFLPSGTFTSLNAGSYTITIKDANGCNTTQDVTITQPNAALTASISSQTNVDCFGNNSGSVTVAGANGTAPYTYAIDGATFLPSGTFASLNAGSYTITIKDANECNTTQEVTITQPNAALTASISSQTNVDCFGNNSGSVTVAGANGTAPYTYAIDGATFLPSGTFTSLNAGSYTITIKDANECNTTQEVTITQPNAALTASISFQTNVDCFGNNSGSVTVAGANGTAPYTYAIDGTTFLPSGTFTSLNAGSYTITIKDANGCNTTQDVTITQPNAALTASISSQTNVDCFGNNSGSVTVAGANGTAPYTYAIDGTTFLPSGTFTSLNAGSYTITIKDANGCNTTQDVTITQPNAALTASISSQTNVDCFGNNSGSVTVAGANGTAPYTYAIDGTTFLPSGTFTSLNAGSYTITIKDANGCNTTQDVTITQPNAALTASISSQTNVDCFGNNSGSVTVAGANGTAPYTYAIDGTTFLPSGTFTSLNAGSYTITIKDANGCNTTQEVTITQPNAALTASISSQTNVDCFGNNSGSVTVAGANGTAPYTYAIDGTTFLPSGTFTSLNAGSYTITIKDANGCNTTQDVTITQPNAALTASISSQTNVDCFGNNSGSVTVAGANGTAPYTYAIDGTTFLPSGTFTSLNAGSYTITIKDANGCNTTQDVTITQPNAALTASISSQTNVDCFGNNSGSVTVAGANGTAPYTYAIDGTIFLPSGTFTSLNAGSYTITIKDANGCNTTQEVTITQPNAALTASISSQTNVDCFGNNSGSVTVAGANGTAPYTYAIDGATFLPSGTFASLNAGSYTITIKDANGCNTTQDVTITQPNAALTASISSQTNVDCFGNNSGSVTVAGANGTAPYTYAIDGATFLPSGTFASLNAGSYTITIKDANGCNTTQDVTITQPNAALTASISSQTNVNCFGNNSGSVTVAGANGTAPYTYAIDGTTFLPSGTFASLNAGSYTITIKDANGCNTTQDVTITQPEVAVSVSGVPTNASCYGEADGSIAITNSAGATVVITNSNNEVVSNTGLVAGIYTLTATAPGGNQGQNCTATAQVTITQPEVSVSVSGVPTNASCYGEADGSIAITNSAGATVVITNSNNEVVANTGLVAGIYTLTATAPGGNQGQNCTATAQVTITQPEVSVSVSGVPTNASCYGEADGSIAVTNSAGATVVITNSNNEVVSNTGLVAGIYTLTATAPGGNQGQNCTATAQVTITQPEMAVSVSGVPTNASCYGEADGSITVTNSAGVTVVITNSNNEVVSNTGLVAGTYTLTATAPGGNQGQNCTATAQVTITQPEVAVSVSGIPTNASCYGEADGSIAVTNSAGATVIITNSNNEVVNNTGLMAGTYTLTATAPGGNQGQNCTATTQVTITQPTAPISASAVITNNNNCVGCSNGSIDITAEGGTAPYTFTWSNGAITEDISSLPKGTYNVEIKDTNGCTANYTYNINESGIEFLKDAVYEDTNQDGITNVGDNIVYNFVVKNTGNVTITNIIVTDNKATVTGGPIASLDAGASDTTTFIGIHAITQDDINKGIYYNIALANAKDNENITVNDNSSDPTPCTTCPKDPECPDCTITELNQIPSITITKDGSYVDTNQDGITNVGDIVSYNFIVKNTGNVTLTNIIVTDNNAIVSGGPIATLAVGAIDTTTFTASHAITQDDINNGIVYNLALATAKDPKGQDVTATSTDPTPCTSCPIKEDCPECTITELTQSPSIALVKTASVSGTAALGDVITYTFTVTNTGNTTLTNIVVTDPLPGLTITGSPIALLEVGASSSVIKGTYTIKQADIDAANVTNSALAIAKDPKGNDVTDISGTTVENDNPTITILTQNPGLEVIKTANTENYSSVGDIINYTIQVKNTGNVTLYSIAVTDPLTGLNTTIESLAPGASQEFNENYTATQIDRENGSVTNTAQANGFTPNETQIHAEDTAVVEAAIVLGCGTIKVHNAFTPNEDGFNDKFIIDNIDDTLCYPENSVEIYNRWGILVYETKGYDNVNKVFKGYSEGRVTVDKSAGLPTGTYFYILNYTAVGLQNEIIAKKEQGYLYLTR